MFLLRHESFTNILLVLDISDLMYEILYLIYHYFMHRIALAKRESLKQASLNKTQGGIWGMIKNVRLSAPSTESILTRGGADMHGLLIIHLEFIHVLISISMEKF